MKRLFILLTAVIMLLSFTACSKKGEEGYSSDTDLYEQAEKLNKNDLSDEEIADVEKRAEADGYTFFWKEDGSLSLELSEEIVYLDGEWIDNRFTKLLDKPSEGFINEVQVLGNSCSVMMNWTPDQAQAYAKEYADEFCNKAEEDNQAQIMGMYTYYGVNDDGVEFQVTCNGGPGMIKVTIPEK